jgi:carbon-monoxide dehydrogenase small subunit
MRITATVNGQVQEVDDVWEGESLLYVLRERLGLPGSKNACEQGECGSCTVYLDGVAVCACLVAAGQADGRSVTTVEGIASAAEQHSVGQHGVGQHSDGQHSVESHIARAHGAGLHPVQEAFISTGAVQCGFCTPGLIVAVHDLLRRHPHPSDPEIREALAGNLCRCTGYEKIMDAVRLAAASAGPASLGPAGPASVAPAGPAGLGTSGVAE